MAVATKAKLIGIIYECPKAAAYQNFKYKSQLLGRKHVEVVVALDKLDFVFEMEFRCPICREHHFVSYEKDNWSDP